MNGDIPLDVNHLVVSAAMQAWNAYHTLGLVYRDAYFSQLNDRYKAKWDEFRKLAYQARSVCLDSGFPMVGDPVSRPTAPTMGLIAGAQGGSTAYVAVTALNAAAQESAPSILTSMQIPIGNSLSIALSSPASNVLSWNVYAGPSPQSMYLQNSAPLGLAGTWIYVPSNQTNGTLAPTGQPGDLIRWMARMLQRG